MYSIKRRDYSDVNVFVVIKDALLVSILKVVTKKVAGVGTIAHKSVNKHNRIMIGPLRSWGVTKFTIHKFNFLIFIMLTH